MARMTEPEGRREASKRATRAAILAAAKQMFADRGFEATTVRDIARAAGVTERTFYRYFDGKEGLIAGEFLAWLAILRQAIIGRPPGEPPVIAIRRAAGSLADRVTTGTGPLPLWLFSDGPPVTSLRRFALRPLLQLESAITEAVIERAGTGAGPDPAFRAKVISRAAVSALRTALIHYREISATGTPAKLPDLIDAAFTILSEEYGPPAG
jgi:AcrR family transcriptional regulator